MLTHQLKESFKFINIFKIYPEKPLSLDDRKYLLSLGYQYRIQDKCWLKVYDVNVNDDKRRD